MRWGRERSLGKRGEVGAREITRQVRCGGGERDHWASEVRWGRERSLGKQGEVGAREITGQAFRLALHVHNVVS